ncbi:DUF6164 family protein [Simiduia aestuariiviva]|uniref:DUF2007 domain-containing protein n=1 Tax=Simiduia aestuariiviva TaxID=1510459 RepID=A0A839UPH1_9GAMM|nr:DUF6164 family protein [Simiduia aestuariiviva]MBB3169742.1 hypothetical protein [Simiduia aestuariiviva]
MGCLYFKLHDVPAPEAEAVRTLLNDADISFYETDAGNWGLSLAAIWLTHEADKARADALLADYQAQHRAEAQAQLAEAGMESLAQRFARQPLRFIAALLAVAAILYLSVMPFTGAWS